MTPPLGSPGVPAPINGTASLGFAVYLPTHRLCVNEHSITRREYRNDFPVCGFPQNLQTTCALKFQPRGA